MFDYFSFYLAEEVENGVIDEGQHDKDGDQFGSICGDKLYCGYQYHQIFIDSKDAVAGDVNLFVILNAALNT